MAGNPYLGYSCTVSICGHSTLRKLVTILHIKWAKCQYPCNCFLQPLTTEMLFLASFFARRSHLFAPSVLRTSWEFSEPSCSNSYNLRSTFQVTRAATERRRKCCNSMAEYMLCVQKVQSPALPAKVS